jgi:hypothetical protein
MVTLRLAIGMLLLLAAPAQAQTITGKLEPGTAKLPRSAKAGQAQVLAMQLDTAAYGGAAQAARNGRYTLKVPPGKWVLRTSVVTPGRPLARFTAAAITTKAGQRRSLPLTLKRFKKPRKKKTKRPRAAAANINPRDGREYPGTAYALDRFAVTAADGDLGVLGTGLPDMLITDLLKGGGCEFTLVEWLRRDAILQEVALQQTEYVDPATRVEPGHIIDPEFLIRGRVEDRPGTPKRLALVAWLVDFKTGAKVSEEVSSVSLSDQVFASEERLAKLILRDLICARATPPAPPPTTAPSAPPPPPPPPPAATNVYVGTFSGVATSELPGLTQTWTGTVRLDAAQDTGPPFPPPNGAPPGAYRIFTVSSGGVDITVKARPPSGCNLDGTGHVDFVPGLLSTVVVQLDVPNPAYTVRLGGLGNETIQVTRSGGPDCTGSAAFPVFSPWASTGELAHTSGSYALSDAQSVLTPEAPYDWDYTTRWSLSPG